jgi:exonuclease SbcC
MRPEQLILRNIGPFRGTHAVDFSGLGDIFLIYGKTGAGKTTIFDAISYAFYGEAPGERKGLARDMRSQYADPAEESAVSFSFTVSGKRWRIKRTLPFEKLGTRSGKIQSVAEEVTLERWDVNGWKDDSSTNKSDTNARIEALLGLSSEEFSRIVLLPQGEFARFLRLNSNERKAVLAKLFPVEKYARVTELARDKARDLTALVKETEASIISLQAHFNVHTYAEERGSIAREMDELKALRESLRSTMAERSAVLEKSRAAGLRKAKEKELAEKLAVLETASGRIAETRDRIALAVKASPLAVRLDAIEAAAAKASADRADLSRIDGEIVAERKRLAELEEGKERLASLAKEKEELILSRERLRIAVDIATGLETELAEYENTKKRLAASAAKKAAIDAESSGLTKALAALESERTALDLRNEEATKARDALEVARQIKALSDEYGIETKAESAHRGAIALIDEDAAIASKDLEIARAELEAIERDAESERRANTAGELSATLEEGKPCPVCGSLSHPKPAPHSDLARFGYAERAEAAKRRIDALVARIAGLEKTRAAREADLANCTARLASLRERVPSSIARNVQASDARGTIIATPEEAAEAVREAAKAAQAAQDALARSRSAWREAEEISRKASALLADGERASREHLELERIAAGQKAEIAQRKARYKEAFPAGVGSDDPADALSRCEARILETEAESHAYEESLKESRAREAALSGNRESLSRALSKLEESLTTDGAAFDKDLADAGFAARNDARLAAMPSDERARLERSVTEHERALAETQSLLADVRKELSAWEGPDTDSVAAELERAKKALAESDAALEEKTGKLTGLDSLKARHDALELERAKRSSEAGRMVALAGDLTGNNPLKTGFDAWILGMYLEEITAYANSRLVRMSEGRYRIQLNDSYRKGNAYAGLELEILDAYTGKARPSATLSGGETFMTSISLALGLADSIQSRSGGIQLDAIFIDEGFGSLDESSLERAITILDEIRGSRMVGIVSHVAELRSRIPNRVEVVKTVAGSSIRKELNTQGEI